MTGKKQPVAARAQRRFGIAEWYGRAFPDLSPDERSHLAQIQSLPKKERPDQSCPFQSKAGSSVVCNKAGGVCSLRLYERPQPGGTVSVAPGCTLSTVCPNRFGDGGLIYQWAGEVLLGCPAPTVLGEIGFLERPAGDTPDKPSKDDVGRIDKILVVPGVVPLRWCALEVQAVYFQGAAMGRDFEGILNHPTDALPFPEAVRRPDYRSSGPKRLMPQLQIKVPSLRRWGKKMAVVVDESFFGAMGKMDRVSEVSNCDVAWFVLRYDESSMKPRLARSSVHLTTLERSVEGLTAGVPVSLEVFEKRILSKLGTS